MSELAALLDRHCQRDFTPTAVPRLMLSRTRAATPLTAAMYHPLLCVVAQGRKADRARGGRVFRYDPGTYLIASADLPVSGQVIEGPCLGMTLTLEPARLAELLREMPPADGAGGPCPRRRWR